MPCSDNDKLIYNIKELPEAFSISSGDLLVVEDIEGTKTIDFDNIIFGLDNTTFGTTITQNATDIVTLSSAVVGNTARLEAALSEVTADFLHNVYLAVRTDGRDGSGLTSDSPRDVSTPAKLQAVYDEYAASAVTFHYAPGVYETNGWARNIRDTAFDNHHHVGSGQDITILRLVGANNPFQDGRIFCAGTNAANKIDNFQVRHMTLDCNAAAQPSWTAGAGGPILAVFLYSATNVLIENCKVVGFGTRGGEAFPIGLIFDTSYPDPNLIVRSCTLTEPATGNAADVSVNLCTGILIIPQAGTYTDAGKSGVYDCRIVDIRSDFQRSFGCQAPIVEGCYITGTSRGIYHEIQPISFTSRTVVIRNNIVKDFTENGIMVFQANAATDFEPQINIQGNIVIPTFANNGSISIQVSTQVADGIQSVIATDNEIRFEDGQGQTAVAASPRGFSFANIENLVLMNNLVTLYSNPGQLTKEIERGPITNDTSVNNFRSNGVALSA